MRFPSVVVRGSAVDDPATLADIERQITDSCLRTFRKAVDGIREGAK